jgi:hypothetical protein
MTAYSSCTKEGLSLWYPYLALILLVLLQRWYGAALRFVARLKKVLGTYQMSPHADRCFTPHSHDQMKLSWAQAIALLSLIHFLGNFCSGKILL